jgi:hypothetical protein
MINDFRLLTADKPPFVDLMRKIGLEPDPWQADVLDGGHHRLLLNCSRQAGKSTVVAVLSLVEAFWIPMTLVLLLSRSHRQSTELFRLVVNFHSLLGGGGLSRKTADELQFTNKSRIVCLPCAEDTVRGYSNVSLLIIDEAARVPDDLYRAVRPMLAISNGRMICLSTPYGKRGFFYNAWARGGSDWTRIEVPAQRIPRIRADYLAEERRALGESWFRQEYCCSFESLEGLVYPDFARCLVPTLPPNLQSALQGVKGFKWVGGLDFGFRNPFAAIWGILDPDSVLWLTGEHYSRQKPLSFHAQHIPRNVTWYADPSGATEIAEFICAGFTVRPGTNDKKPGIAAVRARLENGTLRVLEGGCPNLLAEAALYRYETEGTSRCSEEPVDEHNHALGALRYLISKIDARHMARLRNPSSLTQSPTDQPTNPLEQKWLNIDNEALWTISD